MPKRNRPQPAQPLQDGETVWQPVSVSLERDGEAVLDSNHYDHEEDSTNNSNAKRRARKADVDLEAPPTEEMGIFFGLQVIQPEQYRVIVKPDGTKQFRIVKGNDDAAKTAMKVTADPPTTTKRESKNKKTVAKDNDKPVELNNEGKDASQKTEPPKKKQKKEEDSGRRTDGNQGSHLRLAIDGGDRCHAAVMADCHRRCIATLYAL